MANGWVAPTLNILQSPEGEFRISSQQSSWIASLDCLGRIFGAIFAALMLDIAGRKLLLASSALVFFLMWVITWLTQSASVLCLIRLIFGIFIGLNDGTNSTYLAENSSPVIRGVFGTVCITLYYAGLLVEFAAATYLSYTHTAILNAVITFVALLSVFYLKEPVQFLLLKGKHQQAEKNYAWLHGVAVTEIGTDFQKIKQNAQTESKKKTSFKKILSAPANYKSLFIMITLYCLVGSAGYAPIMSYAPLAFSATDILTTNEFTILFGVAQLLIVVSTSFLIGRFSRRAIILISFLLITLSHLTTAALYHLHDNITSIPYFPWVIFASITLYASIYAFVYPVVFLIRGELFPLSIKATGGCLSIVASSITSFITTKIFIVISDSYGIGANFLIFALVSLLLVLFVYSLLPETKNKSLVEIQEMLENTK